MSRDLRSSPRPASAPAPPCVRWNQHRQFKRWNATAARLIQGTSFAHAPWFIIDAADERHCNLSVTTEVRDALYRRLGTGEPAETAKRRSPLTKTTGPAAAAQPEGLVSRIDRERSVLDALDMRPTLSRGAFKTQLLEEPGRLHQWQRKAQKQGRSLILLFEGWDAAGKAGAIRRVVAALAPQPLVKLPTSISNSTAKRVTIVHTLNWPARSSGRLSRLQQLRQGSAVDRRLFQVCHVEHVVAPCGHVQVQTACVEIVSITIETGRRPSDLQSAPADHHDPAAAGERNIGSGSRRS